jgi:hypothetical protein
MHLKLYVCQLEPAICAPAILKIGEVFACAERVALPRLRPVRSLQDLLTVEFHQTWFGTDDFHAESDWEEPAYSGVSLALNYRRVPDDELLGSHFDRSVVITASVSRTPRTTDIAPCAHLWHTLT